MRSEEWEEEGRKGVPGRERKGVRVFRILIGALVEHDRYQTQEQERKMLKFCFVLYLHTQFDTQNHPIPNPHKPYLTRIHICFLCLPGSDAICLQASSLYS